MTALNGAVDRYLFNHTPVCFRNTAKCRGIELLYLDLIFSVLRGSLRLVEALKGSIHALIEAPVTVYRDPVQITAVLD